MTLLKPKGESNGEHKASLNIARVLSTRRRNPIEADFASGQIPSLPEYLSYFYDLKSLEAEGRCESVLFQLYQLDRKS